MEETEELPSPWWPTKSKASPYNSKLEGDGDGGAYRSRREICQFYSYIYDQYRLKFLTIFGTAKSRL